MTYEFKETPYGFKWGPMFVEREVSDKKLGVLLRVSTRAVHAGKTVYIRISPQGRTITVEPDESTRIEMVRLFP